MIKGAAFTIGILVTIGGFGFAALQIAAAAHSDAPSNGDASGIYTAVGFGVFGIAMIVGTFFV